MAKDVLSIRQLEAQYERRLKVLDELAMNNAPAEAIAEARRKLLLTQRRLERAKAADYDEEIESVQQIKPTE